MIACSLVTHLVSRTFALRNVLFLVAVATAGFGCGQDNSARVAAVPQASGKFGALMVSTEGQMLLPIVSRDGDNDRIVGAMFRDASGTSVTLFLDSVTGLPSKTVLGDFVLLFSNWDTIGKKVDIARIYAPTGYIEIFRDVKLDPGSLGSASSPGEPAPSLPGELSSSLTCFPACESDEKNFRELLKVAGLGLSIGGCGVATAISWGAMALPCAGLLVSTATMVVGDEEWLGNLEEMGNILGAVQVFQCGMGGAESCVAVAVDLAGNSLDLDSKTVEQDDGLIFTAQAALDNPEAPAGIVQGTAPTCLDHYECTPGAYMPCYPEGVKQCNQDCTWSSCPSTKPDPEPDPGGTTTCSPNAPVCNCGTFKSCVTMSGSTCVQAFYKTSAGNFVCASCSNCTGAATSATQACCPLP